MGKASKDTKSLTPRTRPATLKTFDLIDFSSTEYTVDRSGALIN